MIESASFQAVLTSLSEARVQKIIDRLITDHRNKTISAQEALIAVGVIAELRSLVGDFELLLQRNT